MKSKKITINITAIFLAIIFIFYSSDSCAFAVNRTALSSSSSSWWKAQISDYDNSCTKSVNYQVSDDIINDPYYNAQDITVPSVSSSYSGLGGSSIKSGSVIASSDSADSTSSSDAPVSGVAETAQGTFAFTTYGWGHCVGMPQNGANLYAIYSGWDYQQILFHYYPYTTLMQTTVPDSLTVGNMTGSTADVIAAVVELEMGGSMSYEALKAQAVAAYTYIMHYGGVAKDLKGKSSVTSNVRTAVNEVLGQALFYNGDYILALFTASCGGATANCYDIFSMNLPYLRSVSSKYDSYDSNYGTVVTMTIDKVRSTIESRYKITLSDSPENWIKITLTDGGYAAYVTIDGQKTVNGNDFINVLGLKSPKFTYILNY